MDRKEIIKQFESMLDAAVFKNCKDLEFSKVIRESLTGEFLVAICEREAEDIMNEFRVFCDDHHLTIDQAEVLLPAFETGCVCGGEMTIRILTETIDSIMFRVTQHVASSNQEAKNELDATIAQFVEKFSSPRRPAQPQG